MSLSPSGNDVHGVVAFRANTLADDLMMHVEHSVNLVDWQSGAGETELIGNLDNVDGTSQLSFRLLTPVTDTPRQFLRVRFELR